MLDWSGRAITDVPLGDHLTILVFCALATWRVSNLFVSEAGPWDVFTKLRELVGIEYQLGPDGISYPTATPGFLGGLLSCVWCLSLWVAPLMLFLWWLFSPAVVVLAIAGGAVVVARFVEHDR